MSARRVVITGIGLTSPIGHSLDEVSEALRTGRHGVSVRDEWSALGRLDTRPAAGVKELNLHEPPRELAPITIRRFRRAS